jgi:hypothetical protein
LSWSGPSSYSFFVLKIRFDVSTIIIQGENTSSCAAIPWCHLSLSEEYYLLDIMPCSPVEVLRRFGGYLCHFFRISQPKQPTNIKDETSVKVFRTARHHVPEARNLQDRRWRSSYLRVLSSGFLFTGPPEWSIAPWNSSDTGQSPTQYWYNEFTTAKNF